MNVYDDTDYEFVGDDDYWSLGRISLDYNMKWFFFYVFGFISYFYDFIFALKKRNFKPSQSVFGVFLF